MLFLDTEMFLEEAKKVARLSREEEVRLAREKSRDPAAREALIRGYYRVVAASIRRAPGDLQTLKTLYACLDTLEKGVDSFDFLQDSEPFSHHLNWRLRQCIIRCIADKG